MSPQNLEHLLKMVGPITGEATGESQQSLSF